MEKKEKIRLKPSQNSICGSSYNLLNVKLLNGCNGKCEFCIAAGTPVKNQQMHKDLLILLIQ